MILNERFKPGFYALADYLGRERSDLLEEDLDEKLKEIEKDKGLVGFREKDFNYSRVEEPGSENHPAR